MAKKRTRKSKKQTAAFAATQSSVAVPILTVAEKVYQIYIGGTPYNRVCVGNDEFVEIRRGDQLIWKRKD